MSSVIYIKQSHKWPDDIYVVWRKSEKKTKREMVLHINYIIEAGSHFHLASTTKPQGREAHIAGPQTPCRAWPPGITL